MVGDLIFDANARLMAFLTEKGMMSEKEEQLLDESEYNSKEYNDTISGIARKLWLNKEQFDVFRSLETDSRYRGEKELYDLYDEINGYLKFAEGIDKLIQT